MEWLTAIVPTLLAYKYIGILIAVFLTSVIVPIPGGAILLIVGTFAHRGYFSLTLSFLFATLGSVLADLSFYLFMRLFGTEERLARYRMKSTVFEQIERRINSYPFTTVIVSHFIGFTTSATNLLAGFIRMPLRIFVVADIIGCAVCVALYLGIGYAIGSVASEANLLTLGGVIVGVLAVIYLLGVVLYTRHSGKR